MICEQNNLMDKGLLSYMAHSITVIRTKKEIDT